MEQKTPDQWHTMSPEAIKLVLSAGKVEMSAAETCNMLLWLNDMIVDEMKGSKEYEFGAEKFKTTSPFFTALSSMAKDESRHRAILEAMVEVLAPSCECVKPKGSSGATGEFSERCGI